MEQWRDVIGFHGLYFVSDHGRVKTAAGQILKGEIIKGGYLRYSLSAYGGRMRIGGHRIVMMAFVGPVPANQEVNHKDGQTSNNKLDNLEYVTRQQNHQHSWNVLGRKPPHMGTATHFAKLSDEDVRAIRQLRTSGLSYAKIAAQFNTKAANVWHICQGKTWKHLLVV